MNPDKFNPELPCNHMPFGYLEQRTELPGKRAIISFGALEKHSRFCPELGGVALVYTDPDVFIAFKIIPWNAEGRRREHAALAETLQQTDMTNQELAVFLDEDDYILPAMKERWRREYAEKQMAKRKQQVDEEEDLDVAQDSDEIQEPPADLVSEKSRPQFYDGEELIPLD